MNAVNGTGSRYMSMEIQSDSNSPVSANKNKNVR